MSKIIKFGEDVEGYDIPVLNEREVRAAAGILFVLMFASIMSAAMLFKFTLLKYAIVIFLTDMLIRVLISPRFAPTLIIGRWIVRKQTPEYVGATQKKFAWIIGIILGIIMLALQVIVNSFSPITGLICLICLVFLWFETSFGICLGCLSYKWIYRKKAQYCPGEVCELKDRQPIQKVSWPQALIVVGFAVYIYLNALFFHDFFKEKPFDLFGITESKESTDTE